MSAERDELVAALNGPEPPTRLSDDDLILLGGVDPREQPDWVPWRATVRMTYHRRDDRVLEYAFDAEADEWLPVEEFLARYRPELVGK